MKQFNLMREEYQGMCVNYQHLLKRSNRKEKEFEEQLDEYDELVERTKLNSFNNYIGKLAEVDAKLITSQTKLEKWRKKAKNQKKAAHLQYQLKGTLRQLLDNEIAKNSELKRHRE